MDLDEKWKLDGSEEPPSEWIDGHVGKRGVGRVPRSFLDQITNWRMGKIVGLVARSIRTVNDQCMDLRWDLNFIRQP